ncbi:hypothetical protein ABU178_12385 [Pantoea osteomyelitidis]|uniref:Uncharacterized protein n=1 Tax=Pantoea osteomyelitidis TaxID=3230026 RepID=A0ABW7PY92_9GAMM
MKALAASAVKLSDYLFVSVNPGRKGAEEMCLASHLLTCISPLLHITSQVSGEKTMMDGEKEETGAKQASGL